MKKLILLDMVSTYVKLDAKEEAEMRSLLEVIQEYQPKHPDAKLARRRQDEPPRSLRVTVLFRAPALCLLRKEHRPLR